MLNLLLLPHLDPANVSARQHQGKQDVYKHLILAVRSGFHRLTTVPHVLGPEASEAYQVCSVRRPARLHLAVCHSQRLHQHLAVGRLRLQVSFLLYVRLSNSHRDHQSYSMRRVCGHNIWPAKPRPPVALLP